MPFDRSTEASTAKELEAAAAADKNAERMDLIRKAGLGLLVAVLLLVVWLKGRRRSKARKEATSYVVEQLRQEQAQRAGRRPAAGRPRGVARHHGAAACRAGRDRRDA